MFHTERDYDVFAAEMLLLLGALMGAVCAVAALVALALQAFRSRAALYAWLALSAVASIPCLWALERQRAYLPELWDTNPSAGLLTLLNGALLCFVWLAPPMQYRRLRRKPGRENRALQGELDGRR